MVDVSSKEDTNRIAIATETSLLNINLSTNKGVTPKECSWHCKGCCNTTNKNK